MLAGKDNPVGQHCPCSKPAVKWFGGWVCADCLAIEQRIAHDNNHRRHSGFEFGIGRAEKPQDKYYHIYQISY